jgi:hypothetical protein
MADLTSDGTERASGADGWCPALYAGDEDMSGTHAEHPVFRPIESGNLSQTVQALFWACGAQQIETTTILIAHGANVNARGAVSVDPHQA